MDGDSKEAVWQGIAGEAQAGERLDKVLAGLISTMSRARLQAIIREGGVRLRGVAVCDPSVAVREGDDIEVAVPEAKPATVEGEDIPLRILHEDDHLIVIDKPAGLTVHPGAGNARGTLVNALIAHCGTSLSGIGGVMRPGIVHRLDKDTTGLMVIAKHDEAHRDLSRQFADHGRTGDLRREYIALVWGEPRPRAGRIETLIGRHPASRTKMAVVRSGGRVAITHYVVERTFGNPVTTARRKIKHGTSIPPLASVVRCRLETGRTHQVRVHLAFKGTPLIGDPLYGLGHTSRIRGLPGEVDEVIMKLGRQALHAVTLAFRHPVTGRVMTFESEIPEDMAKVCRVLETVG
jgi:23S rRNA pseudouridine1911/1915/1917 synthase